MDDMTKTEFAHAHELNNLVLDIETTLDNADHNPTFAGIAHRSVVSPELQIIRDSVERDLPELQRGLKETILNVVRENVQPEDHAAFQDLFWRIRRIVADAREQITPLAAYAKHEKFAKQRFFTVDQARALQMLLDLDAFEGLAAEYEGEIFKICADKFAEA